ncbi:MULTISPECIES: DUF4190 domain-containing protein [Streptomycetaceae]|uniref:DUF4190 domain-containing protein n=1 Tax=Streptomycetaceae TaxID=2062 RepID=UPI000A3F5547|nr:DUF4190 domain-containing protein [Streptomyces sp. CB02056]
MSTVTDRIAIGRIATGRQNIDRPERQAQQAARQTTGRQGTAEADGLAVASFLLGLPGLLLFNIVLGPIAITLATLALVRGTNRRGRAVLGLTLGIASLAILAVTTATSHGVLIDISS